MLKAAAAPIAGTVTTSCPSREAESTVVRARASTVEMSAALITTSPVAAFTLPPLTVAPVLPSTMLTAMVPAAPRMLATPVAWASAVSSRAFWAMSVTSVAALVSLAVSAAVTSRSARLMAEPRPRPRNSRSFFSWAACAANCSGVMPAVVVSRSVSVSTGSAMAEAVAVSIAVTDTDPVRASRREAAAVAVVLPFRAFCAWIARDSTDVSLPAAARSEAAARETPRTATRTVSSTVVSA
ncbi:hypothetical protein CHKEEEPN_1642 [Methylorubrum podarium]|nr:hypothetical protein CHKEEEPN_1642 [Methylorubrum podarium]